MPQITLPPPTPELGRAMLGIWVLSSREDYDAQGMRHIDPVLGPNPLGMLCFASGRFAAQFMNRERTATSAVAMAGANNSGAVNGYDGYFGTYSLNPAAGTIAIRLEGAVSPGDVGKELTRTIRVTGDHLIIQLSTTAASGIPVVRTLVFDRTK